MTVPTWALLRDPVPHVVTVRAVELLQTLSLGDTRTERVDVDCVTNVTGKQTQILRYVCETHPPDPGHPLPHKGITVYGLI